MRIVQTPGQPEKSNQDVEIFTTNFLRHKKMIANSTGSSNVRPVMYTLVRENDRPASSSSSMPAKALEHYQSIQAKLSDLALPGADREIAEVQAAKSALVVVEQLKRQLMAPPEVASHGGDAIVMLWAIANRTFAITVTEGELGYVVRENRKTIKLGDAISIENLKLELFE
jgi:hypothetical protein